MIIIKCQKIIKIGQKVKTVINKKMYFILDLQKVFITQVSKAFVPVDQNAQCKNKTTYL